MAIPFGQAVLTETDVASAATCDIGAVSTVRVNVTGTTTITSFGATLYRLRFIRFAAALTLTHHATSLVLPGGANITTAAGDTCIAFSDASGNWRVYNYQKASGKAVIGPASTDITDSTAAGRTLLTAANVAAQLAALGAVTGPASAVANRIPIWSGTSGKILQDSTYALPSGSLVGTSDSQTLTNKTLTSPAITTPTGIVKGDVGLGNVDNTADTGKPVSTAQQTALDLKLNISDLASQSDQETGTSNTKWVSPGRQHHHDSAAKAWGYVTVSAGTPTLQDSFNIAGITDTGAGRLTWTIGTDFSSVNYAVLINSELGAGVTHMYRRIVSQAAGSFEQRHYEDGNIADPADWHCVCYGDQ